MDRTGIHVNHTRGSNYQNRPNGEFAIGPNINVTCKNVQVALFLWVYRPYLYVVLSSL